MSALFVWKIWSFMWFWFGVLWSGGGLGTQQAISDRGCAGVSTAGWWSPNQDTLHRSLSHWCLYLEWQGACFLYVLFYVYCWNVSGLVVWLVMLFCDLNGLLRVVSYLFRWVCDLSGQVFVEVLSMIVQRWVYWLPALVLIC